MVLHEMSFSINYKKTSLVNVIKQVYYITPIQRFFLSCDLSAGMEPGLLDTLSTGFSNVILDLEDINNSYIKLKTR